MVLTTALLGSFAVDTAALTAVAATIFSVVLRVGVAGVLLALATWDALVVPAASAI